MARQGNTHRTTNASTNKHLFRAVLSFLDQADCLVENALPHIFIWAGLVFGLLFLLITPPFQVPDEIVHFHRAFAISEGHIIMQRQGDAVGADMPLSIHEIVAVSANLPFHAEERQNRDLLRSMLQRPLQPENRTFIQVSGAANYAPVPYLPHVLGIWTGRLLGLPALALLYMARLFGLVAYLLLVGISIRMIPWGKGFLALLALLPMSLTEAMGVSADSVTLGLSFLLFALVMRQREKLCGGVQLFSSGKLCGGWQLYGGGRLNAGGYGAATGAVDSKPPKLRISASLLSHTGIPLREWMVYLLLSATLPLCKNLYILMLGMLLLLPLCMLEATIRSLPRQGRRSGNAAGGSRGHASRAKHQKGTSGASPQVKRHQRARGASVQVKRNNRALNPLAIEKQHLVRQALLLIAGILICWGVALLVFFLWNHSVATLSTPSPIDGTDPAAQVQFLLRHPFQVFRLLLDSMASQLSRNLAGMIGILGWLDTPLPTVVYVAFGILLASMLVLDGPRAGIAGSGMDAWSRTYAGLLFLGISLAVYGSLFVVWTPVGGSDVIGVQGRYFTVLMPLLLAACGYRPSRGGSRIKLLMLPAVPLLLGVSLHAVYLRYWVS